MKWKLLICKDDREIGHGGNKYGLGFCFVGVRRCVHIVLWNLCGSHWFK